MINFKEYFYLKEDPDYVDIDNEDLKIEIEYDEGNPYGFGFVNTQVEFMGHKPLEELKEEQGKLIIGEHYTHGQLKKLWLKDLNEGIIKTTNPFSIQNFDLSDPLQKKEFTNTAFWGEINGRMILSPAGRVWKDINNELNNKLVTLISFWHFKDKNKNIQNDPTAFSGYNKTKILSLEIKPEHVVKVLNHLNIPKEEWFNVYVEFIEDEVEGPKHPRTTAMDFINSFSSKQAEKSKEEPEVESDEKKQKMAEVQAKMRKGAHGNVLNPDFGSTVQAKKAQQAGLPSYAEYHAKRYPYGESVNSNKK